MIYAHTDATAREYSITLNVSIVAPYYHFGYEAHAPRLRGIIFPKIVTLCEFQVDRAKEAMGALLLKLYPSEMIGKILKAEASRETSIKVLWPGK